jgi:hypothetical protein
LPSEGILPTYQFLELHVILPLMEHKTPNAPTEPKAKKGSDSARTPEPSTPLDEFPKEIGGPKGLEPTRYGDWERNGRTSDF